MPPPVKRDLTGILNALRRDVDSLLSRTPRGTLPDGITWRSGTGAPNGVVAAPVGSLYSRLDGAAGSTLYVKESGTGNTGWVAK